MRIVVGAMVVAMTSGVALAQDNPIHEYVAGLVSNFAGANTNTLVDKIKTTELYEGDSESFLFDIDPNKTYYVYGACDDDCSDVDLTVYDADGEEVDSDDEEDDAPYLKISAGDAGSELEIEISMSACETDVCVAGFGLYEAAD